MKQFYIQPVDCEPGMLDVTLEQKDPGRHVEVKLNTRMGVLWINIDGVCIVRVCRASKIEVTGGF